MIRQLARLFPMAMMIAGAQPAASAIAPNLTGEGVLVRFKPGTTDSHIAAVRDLHDLEIIRDFPALSASGGIILHLRSASHSNPELIALLGAEPSVAVAEPNRVLTLCSLAQPNDTLFAKQWGLRNVGQLANEITGTAGADIKYIEANSMAKTTLPETVVAVIDNGIDMGHIDLAENLWRNPGEIPWDGIDNDANGKIDDVLGFNFNDNNGNPSAIDSDNPHGTAVAGIICAKANNGEGIAGAAPGTKVMALRITNSQNEPDLALEISAIDYVLLMKSKGTNIVAINASLTHTGYSSIEESAIHGAENANIVFCCAAGNQGSDNTANPVYPANYRRPNMIVVAASDANDELIPESNYGTMVDLAAPGYNIESTGMVWPNIRPTPEPVVSKVTHNGTEYTASFGVMYSGTTTGLCKQLVNCGLGLVSTDFPSATTGSIALIERGGPLGSTLALKTRNAMRAGAVGVVFYDNTSGTTPPNSLISRDNWVPAVFLPRAAGLSLLAALPTAVTLTSKPTGTWTTPDYLTMPNAYVAPAGTSTATPFVSAAVAFAAANYPSETAAQRVARVINGTTPVGALSGRVLSGGRLDLTGIIDADRDQMPDWWEIQHFGSTAATAGGDPDGDRFTNLQEYRIGTFPNNPFSRFTITQAGTTVGGGFSITFPTAADVVYRVEFSESLAAGSWAALGGDVSGTGAPATVTDPAATTLHPLRFYRVRIVSP